MGLAITITSFFKALGQIGDPRFRKVLVTGVGLTFVLLIAAYAAFLAFLNWIGAAQTVQELIGEVSWLPDLITWTSFFVMLALSVFLMVPVASAITSMFLDEVAQAVEDRHYPDLPPVPSVPFGDALRDTVNFLGVLIAANLLALVIYAFFPPMALFIFWGLNGFLLGREYFQLAAMRRVGRDGAKALRRKHIGTIWLAGTLMAMPLSIPLINLLIPILGAATFTHLFHKLEGR
ncbi:EI24 domain-containing protein [Thiosulfatihalobacter marinus]|uniref:EI24 domain-containing protein n=1 Tax=Thiosulfatihalobacter marinus TaxID=2792481 RepID=UPI001E50C192|nr:EI24 domain-containing protein [Thiosulfatihalobacter marinus]